MVIVSVELERVMLILMLKVIVVAQQITDRLLDRLYGGDHWCFTVGVCFLRELQARR